MEHTIPNRFLTRPVRILVVGAGGTGSQMLTNLARMHHTLKIKGHPGGFEVTLIDDDIVSEANMLKQAFWPGDVGLYKAPVVINRINLSYALQWKSKIAKLNKDTETDADIIIGCVDTRAARLAIQKCGTSNKVAYWLDCGNKLDSGQVVLGEFPKSRDKRQYRLPTVADLFPDLVDPSQDDVDETPSCSVEEAMLKQSMMINSGMSLWANNLLFEFFTSAKISFHGNFVNLKRGRTNPLVIDPVAWQRMGYTCLALKSESNKIATKMTELKKAA